MKEKKREHDILEKKHIFQIWEEDLDKFLEKLDVHEAKEEKDRLAHGTGKLQNGKGYKKPANKKVQDKKPKKQTSP